MTEKNPILSISLLCCGRYENTVRCLNSLDSLRKKISCELVIVDTGCDEKTRSFIEQKADKIIEFEWCKDFAKARNAGLESCSGQWFMFIDDDEYITNPTDLVEFFKCGEYKKCTSVSLIIRNYLDEALKTWNDTIIMRVVKLTPEVRFIGRIHEYINNAPGRCAIVHTVVGHTGYIFQTIEDQIEHSKRNIPPLIDAIKDEPKNMGWRAQLAQEYYALEDWDKLLPVCFESIDKFNEDKSTRYGYLGCFYTGIAYAYNSMGDYQQALNAISIALDDDRINDLAKVSMAHEATLAYFGLKQYENVLDMGDFYIELYDSFKDDSVKLYTQMAILAEHSINDYERNRALSAYIEAGVKLGRVECILTAFPRMEFGKEKVWTSRDFVDAIIDAMSLYDYQEWYADVYEAVAIHENLAELLIVLTEFVEIERGPAGVARMNRVIGDVIARGNLNWPRLEALHKKWNS